MKFILNMKTKGENMSKQKKDLFCSLLLVCMVLILFILKNIIPNSPIKPLFYFYIISLSIVFLILSLLINRKDINNYLKGPNKVYIIIGSIVFLIFLEFLYLFLSEKFDFEKIFNIMMDIIAVLNCFIIIYQMHFNYVAYLKSENTNEKI